MINGGYFDAYSRDGVADPYHTLVVNGWPQSLGSVGSVLAIAPDGTAQVERGNPVPVIIANPTLMRRPVLVGEQILHVGFNAQDYERLFATS